MEIKQYAIKVVNLIKKFKYAAIVLVIGIALMLIPNISSSKSTKVQNTNTTYRQKLDEDLASILCKVEGTGRVEVILTVSEGEQTVYQTDTDQSGYEQKTVIVSNSSRTENGLVMRVDPAKYLGAIVLCQGADSHAVRLAVTEAVSKITGLGTDRICVLKMK